MTDNNFIQKDFENEVWKECVQDDRYDVSNYGRVKRTLPSLGAQCGKILKPMPHPISGYVYVAFPTRHWHRGCGKPRYKRWAIHQLICATFNGTRPTDKHEPNHIDTDRTNNRADNLEWKTRKENLHHSNLLGRHPHGESQGQSKVTEQTIRLIFQLLDEGLTGRAIAKQVGLCTAQVSRIKTRKHWKHVIV